MAKTASTMLPLGTVVQPFTLPDPSGTLHHSFQYEDGDAFLVAFLCNHCPFVKHLNREFAAFAAEYRERGLWVVGINSNDADAYPADGAEAMAREAEDIGYGFPYLIDENQEVAKAYRAACTPDFFLFDGEGILVYRGQFDASRPGSGIPVSGQDLRAATDAVLEGRSPTADQLPSVGCNIKWKPGNAPDYFG